MTRRGVTLVELTVVMLVSILVAAALWNIFSFSRRRSVEVIDESGMVTELRGLLDLLARDMNETLRVLPPGSPPAGASDPRDPALTALTDLTLFTFAGGGEIPDRLARNVAGEAGKAYPFLRPARANVHVIPGTRIRYRFDPERRTVTREEAPGVLRMSSSPGEPERMIHHEFRPDGGGPPPRTLATSVAGFDLRHVGYDQRGAPRLLERNDELGETACIEVHVKASSKEPGAPTGGHHGRDRVVEIRTRMWSMARLQDALYPEYFSSVDEDLRY